MSNFSCTNDELDRISKEIGWDLRLLAEYRLSVMVAFSFLGQHVAVLLAHQWMLDYLEFLPIPLQQCGLVDRLAISLERGLKSMGIVEDRILHRYYQHHRSTCTAFVMHGMCGLEYQN